MRIGEVADKAGVTTKGLRYYERVGLLGEPARTASGYRDYSDAVLDRLGFIRASQAAGLTWGRSKRSSPSGTGATSRARMSSTSSKAGPLTSTAASPSSPDCATNSSTSLSAAGHSPLTLVRPTSSATS